MLSDILPRDELSVRLGSAPIFTEFGPAQINAIAREKPSGLHEVAANVWNRIVQKGWHQVNPMQFVPYFQTSSPDLYKAISRLLDIEVIHDIYLVKGWKEPKRKSNLVVELLVAHVYPDDLHLADIAFFNPAQPIAKRDRTFAHQTHRGFGLLPLLMENLQAEAVHLGCGQITLTAASRDQVPLFQRYGFVVEDSTMGRAAMEHGAGIPMERDA